jgi:hypothetical protein
VKINFCAIKTIACRVEKVLYGRGGGAWVSEAANFPERELSGVVLLKT